MATARDWIARAHEDVANSRGWGRVNVWNSSRQDDDAFPCRSKADVAYDEIRAAILAGDLPPGTVLKQEQLADELGVSTTPLRAALRRLESGGFVSMPSHRDAIVSPLDAGELLALYEVREALDSLAAALAAERYDEADADAMAEAAGRLSEDGGDPVAANRALHASIYRASHNPVLIAQLDSLWDRSDRYRIAIRGIARRPEVIESHRAIVATVLSRDAKEAAAKMRVHINDARRSAEEAIASSADGRLELMPEATDGR
jgi:DNA-binding GntR family transcriptional regulator